MLNILSMLNSSSTSNIRNINLCTRTPRRCSLHSTNIITLTLAMATPICHHISNNNTFSNSSNSNCSKPRLRRRITCIRNTLNSSSKFRRHLRPYVSFLSNH